MGEWKKKKYSEDSEVYLKKAINKHKKEVIKELRKDRLVLESERMREGQFIHNRKENEKKRVRSIMEEERKEVEKMRTGHLKDSEMRVKKKRIQRIAGTTEVQDQ